jgi:predicted ester cyclase
MTASDGASVVERLLEAFAAGDTDAVEELVDPGFVNHGLPPVPGARGDRAGLVAAIRYLRTAFPDARAELVGIVVDGDLVGVHDRLVGTHDGEFRGIAPTGRAVSVDFVHLFRVVDGRIVERWGVADNAELMRQLGVA